MAKRLNLSSKFFHHLIAPPEPNVDGTRHTMEINSVDHVLLMSATRQVRKSRMRQSAVWFMFFGLVYVWFSVVRPRVKARRVPCNVSPIACISLLPQSNT